VACWLRKRIGWQNIRETLTERGNGRSGAELGRKVRNSGKTTATLVSASAESHQGNEQVHCHRRIFGEYPFLGDSDGIPVSDRSQRIDIRLLCEPEQNSTEFALPLMYI
jgi:hypothetical protein